MRPTKSVSQMTRKMSKAERQAREEAEAQVVTNLKSKPEPCFFMSLNEEQKAIFERFAALNENFTEADSISLTILSINLYHYNELYEVLHEMDVLDERAASLERRLHAYEKTITAHMNLLCIPLNQRLRLANDMARLAIEEKKLEEMNNQQPVEENPLWEVLEMRKHVK
ncbi:hypothetical protein COL65_02420 [Priestia aryabhattai]|uniref:hypothetical protein n=1 Tax=Priestia aryabhattai TaxID=412384 RepID=UPI000BF93E67|nr:hypothetical protein [Priestia aryabhattai]PGA21963.1 hypothetical protein COL65_02420 [Priestia aryabhattai]